jgi:hypothetical protein
MLMYVITLGGNVEEDDDSFALLEQLIHRTAFDNNNGVPSWPKSALMPKKIPLHDP